MKTGANQIFTASALKGRTERGGLLYGAVVSALVSAGTAVCMAAAFPSAGFGWPAAALTAAAMALVYCLLLSRLPAGLTAALAGAAAAVYAAVLFSQIRAGLSGMGNDFLTFLTARTGRIYLSYSGAGNAGALFALVLAAASFPAALSAMRSRLLPAALPVLLLAGGTVCGLFTSTAGLAMALAGFLLLVLLRLQAGNAGRSRCLPVQALALLAGCAILAVPLYLMNTGLSTALPEQAEQALHDLRYSGNADSMPEGRLSNLGVWDKDGTPALSVTMEKWQKLYLRGFSGDIYTGTAWQTVANEDKAGSTDAFYWLHQNGLYGQTMAASALQTAGETKTAEISVVNLNACRCCSYLPTTLADSSLLDAGCIGDDAAAGAENETAAYVPAGLEDLFEARQQLANSQNSESTRQYLAAEQAYRDYVYTYDLQLTETAAGLLSELTGGSREALTLSEIKGRVLEILDETLTYDESAATLNGSNDFASYTVQQNHAGYSVHYATLATLLLRWYGVPARYCEGYYVSAAQAGRYADGETVTLYETSAHAWTEYYLDGVGWIPFEVTPPYRDEEEQQIGQGAARELQTYQNDYPYTPPLTQEELTDTTGWRGLSGLRPVYLLLLIPAVLLGLLIPVLFRRKRLKKRLAGIARLDNRTAVQENYAYACLLMNTAEVQAADGQAEMAELNLRARFSTHEITDEERMTAETYAKQAVQGCRKVWKPWQRLYYRTWHCLYL